MLIRPLSPTDAAAYFHLRQEMLRDSPSAFGSSPEDDRFSSIEVVRERFSDQTSPSLTIGAFEDQTLVGVASAHANTRLKQRHIAGIGGMYVKPKFQNKGIGRQLLDEAIHHIEKNWPQIERVAISVSDDNPIAQHLYEHLGFKPWGHEPSAVRLEDGREVGHIHMSMQLTQR